jgi:LPS-assembly lipoprotein
VRGVRAIASFLLLAGTAVVAGCGFHLQGRPAYISELESVYLQVPDRSTDLARELRRSLQVADVRLVSRPEEATAILEIVRDSSGREVESVSAANRPQEYRVFYTATYRVKAGGAVLLTPQNVTRTRIYTWNEIEVLAKDHEESLLRGALAREIAGVIARRLATIEISAPSS